MLTAREVVTYFASGDIANDEVNLVKDLNPTGIEDYPFGPCSGAFSAGFIRGSQL